MTQVLTPAQIEQFRSEGCTFPIRVLSTDEALEISAAARLRDADAIFSMCPEVTVRDGVVHLWGQVRSQAERDAARVAVENIEGINGVEDHLSVVQSV